MTPDDEDNVETAASGKTDSEQPVSDPESDPAPQSDVSESVSDTASEPVTAPEPDQVEVSAQESTASEGAPSDESASEPVANEPTDSDTTSTSATAGTSTTAATSPSARRPHALVPYVSWGGRVLAYLVDAVPVLVFAFIVNLVVKMTETTSIEVIGRNAGRDIQVEVTHTSALGVTLQVLAFIVILAYWFWNKGYREGTTGKSIGKQMLGFTTIDEETHKPLGAKIGCIRVLLLFVDFFICYIGVLWPLWDVKKQTFLSDRFTNAIVLRD